MDLFYDNRRGIICNFSLDLLIRKFCEKKELVIANRNYNSINFLLPCIISKIKKKKLAQEIFYTKNERPYEQEREREKGSLNPKKSFERPGKIILTRQLIPSHDVSTNRRPSPALEFVLICTNHPRWWAPPLPPSYRWNEL